MVTIIFVLNSAQRGLGNYLFYETKQLQQNTMIPSSVASVETYALFSAAMSHAMCAS